MKLVYTELEQQLVFQENKVNVLVIERKELFRRMIQELDKQISGEDGGFVLSANNKTLSKIVSNCFSIFLYLSLSYILSPQSV